jgi:hypothetical protein
MLDTEMQQKLARKAFRVTVPWAEPSVGPRRRKDRRRRALLVGIGSLVVSVLAVSTYMLSASRVAGPEGTETPNMAHLELLGPGPLPGGVETTLSAAEALAGFAILRPQDQLASDESLATVWVSTVGPLQVAMEYQSGVLVLLKQSEVADPLQDYEDMAKENSASHVTTVNEAPALMLTGSGGPSIDLVIDEVNVQIQSRDARATVDDILKVAASIAQT